MFQIEDACNQVKNDPILNSTRFNAVGFSQGSQFLWVTCLSTFSLVYYYNSSITHSRRGLIQRCPEAKVKNLITFGGQHQGTNISLMSFMTMKLTFSSHFRRLRPSQLPITYGSYMQLHPKTAQSRCVHHIYAAHLSASNLLALTARRRRIS